MTYNALVQFGLPHKTCAVNQVLQAENAKPEAHSYRAMFGVDETGIPPKNHPLFIWKALKNMADVEC